MGEIGDVIYMMKALAGSIHRKMGQVYEDDLNKRYLFSNGTIFLIGFAAACGKLRTAGGRTALERGLKNLEKLLSEPLDDPFSLGEYHAVTEDITSSRGRTMRKLVYETFLRYFNGVSTLLDWNDSYRMFS